MQPLRDAVRAKQAQNEAKDWKGFTEDAVRDMAATNLNRRIYMAHKHATDTYNAATAELESAANRMYGALQTLIECEKDTTEKAKQAIGRAKDSAAQIGDALARVNKLIGPDFEARLAQLERTATALDNLAELDKAGKLAGVIAALKG